MQNGYQGQKRNIVDDAKFETKVNEEEKKNWINHVRRKSQGKTVEHILLVDTQGRRYLIYHTSLYHNIRIQYIFKIWQMRY